jgi:hypothetical protein
MQGVTLAAIMLSLLATRAAGVTPLSTWTQGIATNYGGAQDGLQPDQPSFGTIDVRLPPLTFPPPATNMSFLL